MHFKYDKLLGKIKEKCGTQQNFSESMGITPQTINAKLSNKAPWKQNEILRACYILEIRHEEIPDYFFIAEY